MIMKADLLRFVESGGCSSKISPLKLQEVLKKLPLSVDPNILVDHDTHDDAGVYKVNDNLALVLTTDFFPPLCSDPYEFGQIAAANSISDVYAMGGTPVVALNLMMFPSSELSMDDYFQIMKGGADKASEAGVCIIGGHTIDDPVPKYGLAVIGYINPLEVVTNKDARQGESLILTKPLGTGIIIAGHRAGLISGHDLGEALESMKTLNRSGADVMKKYKIRGATDITGYGLAGHVLKMAEASEVTISLNMGRVPLFGSVYKLADDGCIPGAAFRNQAFVEDKSFMVKGLDYNLKMIAMDAQTSGGLLMSVPKDVEEEVLDELHSAGLTSSAVIGSVLPKEGKYLILEN
jgi:selenide,water dikinase